jgi:hypothetical protein
MHIFVTLSNRSNEGVCQKLFDTLAIDSLAYSMFLSVRRNLYASSYYC